MRGGIALLSCLALILIGSLKCTSQTSSVNPDSVYCYTESELREIAVQMLEGDHCDSVLTIMVKKEKLYKDQIGSLNSMLSFKDAQSQAMNGIINLQGQNIAELQTRVKKERRKTYGVSVLCAVICGMVVFFSLP